MPFYEHSDLPLAMPGQVTLCAFIKQQRSEKLQTRALNPGSAVSIPNIENGKTRIESFANQAPPVWFERIENLSARPKEERRPHGPADTDPQPTEITFF